jgi:molybdate transport system substrate-binding protein
MRQLLVCALLAFTWRSAAPIAAGDDLHVMVSGAFSAAYKVLVAEWERSSGHKVTTISGASMGAAPTAIPARLSRGEYADVVILARTSLDALVKDGQVVGGTVIDLADSRIGMAVKAGAPQPRIGTVDELRRVLIDATSIGYSESASGVYISTQMFKTLGIDAQVAGKAKMISGRPVADAIAKGELAIGFQQISEILPVAGVTLVGPIPDAVQSITTFSAGISSGSRSPATARQLIEHLASAQAQQTIRQTGLDPAKAPHQSPSRAFSRIQVRSVCSSPQP